MFNRSKPNAHTYSRRPGDDTRTLYIATLHFQNLGQQTFSFHDVNGSKCFQNLGQHTLSSHDVNGSNCLRVNLSDENHSFAY